MPGDRFFTKRSLKRSGMPSTAAAAARARPHRCRRPRPPIAAHQAVGLRRCEPRTWPERACQLLAARGTSRPEEWGRRRMAAAAAPVGFIGLGMMGLPIGAFRCCATAAPSSPRDRDPARAMPWPRRPRRPAPSAFAAQPQPKSPEDRVRGPGAARRRGRGPCSRRPRRPPPGAALRSPWWWTWGTRSAGARRLAAAAAAGRRLHRRPGFGGMARRARRPSPSCSAAAVLLPRRATVARDRRGADPRPASRQRPRHEGATTTMSTPPAPRRRRGGPHGRRPSASTRPSSPTC